MGVNLDRTIAFTFVLGGMLGGGAGFLWGMQYGRSQMGFVPGLYAFTAAVLGGIGNIRGAMLGGLLLGLVQIVPIYWFSGRARGGHRLRRTDRGPDRPPDRTSWASVSGGSA